MNAIDAARGEAPSIERLERAVHLGTPAEAVLELERVLLALEIGRGGWAAIGTAATGDTAAVARDTALTARLATAVAALFLRRDLVLGPENFRRLVPYQRWIAVIFGASPLGSADHVIRHYDAATHGQPGTLTLGDEAWLRTLLLYSLDSGFQLDFERLWQRSRPHALGFFLALLSARIVASPQAQATRERLLEWLPGRLAESSLGEIPFDILHCVWMNCSYASGPGKHRIKRALNDQVRKLLHGWGLRDRAPAPAAGGGKPALLCVLEAFGSSHSIYRTHSTSMAALRSRFRLVGLSLRERADDQSLAIFDEVHRLPVDGVQNTVRRALEIAEAVKPQVVYYPSAGMSLETVFLVNLRLAPLQLVALGHPATTHSDCVDAVVVEEDYLGDPECFSEPLLVVPPEAIPYRPRAHWPQIAPASGARHGALRIAVAASVMKINAAFLDALRAIAERSPLPVEFQFFPAGAVGLSKVYLENLVLRALGRRAVVFPELSFEDYLRQVNACDMFLNPFPFGNTNGIVDTVRQGLPGVCLSGREVHSRIDEGLFRRLGLPAWLVTRSVEEYVAAAVRLAGDAQLRAGISAALLKSNPEGILFRGNAAIFADSVGWMVENQARLKAAGTRVLKPSLAPDQCA